MSKRILTGVKPTGAPHIGNYFGTFRPALARADEYDEAYWFIANYHALNQIQDAAELENNTLSIAATWLACGLNPESAQLYAQSDIPEVFELETMLNSFTPKGWMNKAHAYKAANDINEAEGRPSDDGISMGLYTYPILMAADILVFDANVVPVGKDQIQHVEIARDIAQKINHHYEDDLFVLPEHRVEDSVGTIVGIDGRKMSKSYNNIIPLFADRDERQNAINKIVTDSSAPDEEKQVEGTPLFTLFQLVSTPEEATALKTDLEQGKLGWGDAKQQLGDAMDKFFGEMTTEYNRLMANPDEIRSVLQAGANRVRPSAQEHLQRLRSAMGVI